MPVISAQTFGKKKVDKLKLLCQYFIYEVSTNKIQLTDLEENCRLLQIQLSHVWFLQ